MNKKASMDTIINVVRLVIVIAVFFSIVTVTKIALREKIDVFESESKILIHRLALSKYLNFFDNEINRLYVGMIDIDKFNSEDFKKNILNSIYYGSANTEASAKLILKDVENGKVYETYYNEELYKEKKVLVDAKLIGIGAAKGFITDFYVLIKDKDKLRKGVLSIDAILPNR